MTPAELIDELQRSGVQLWEESGQLRYRAPRGVLTEDRRDALRAQREAVVALLREEAAPSAIAPVPGSWHEPFPLTDVQAAYLLGRHEAFGFGGVACHVYLEVSYPDLDPGRLEAAWNRLIERHDMMRVVIEADGYQRVLATVPHLKVPVADLCGATDQRVSEELEAVRAEMGHRVHETTRWPLFELRGTRTASGALLHLSLDFLVADWASISLLLGELEALHADPGLDLPALDLRFRDYVLAERRLRETGRYRRDRDYWLSRIDELPSAPDLPVVEQAADSVPAAFRRRRLRLDASAWERLKLRARASGLTASTAVLAAYAEVIERWSRTPRFTLNLTVLNRLPLHPEVDQIVGDFTSVSLLAVDGRVGASFSERAAAIGRQLFDDLDHRLYSGVEVMREIARRRGRGAALMPVVFTSAIGLGAEQRREGSGRLDGFGITQTPQVFIDCQAMDGAEGLLINWDVRDGVFPDGLVDDMFDAFEALLGRLAANDDAWDSGDTVPLAAWQAEGRRRANDTAAPLPDALLHHELLAQALRTPERTALISPHGRMSYQGLAAGSAAVAGALRANGCQAGERVAIVMDRGVHQVTAVVGTLLAGAVYLPLDTIQPSLRRDAILRDAAVRLVLTQSWVAATSEWPAGTRVVTVDELAPLAPAEPPEGGDPDAAAYVIYTSGSTGRPKGVVISHRAAGNTVADINRRFAVAGADRVLGLANLGFDLSVYDIFGPLSAGGTLVLPDAERRADPSHWAELIAVHGVTLWNSVPAQMQMLVSYLRSEPTLALPSLRLGLLSGDWIPVTLPDEIRSRLPGLKLISLGGATEAAIWSIHHPIDRIEPGWPSIPYGIPLANQGFRVLDAALRDRPVWAVGELYISGAGLAQGYLGDEELTEHRFVTHPAGGQRLYRTGDLGRYRPGGEIEFLGREDTQVKVRGHRIELGEIEAALIEHPAVAAAAVVLDGPAGSERGLLGVVETVRRAGPPASVEDAGRLTSLVRAAADQEARGIDRRRVEAFVEHLDDAVLGSMAHALGRLGVLAAPGDANTAAEVLEIGGIATRHHWLVRRWLDVLADAGFFEVDSSGHRFACRRPVEGRAVEQSWREAERAWSDELGSPGFVRYLRRNAESLPSLLTGEQDPVALLFPEGRFDTADILYRENAMSRYLNRAVSAVVHRIAVAGPQGRRLRVLEVGAGTGATSDRVVGVLSGVDVDYLFTDASPFFLPAARARFGEHPCVRFGLFDIDEGCRAQGLAPNSFDVVLAAGVLENARDIERSLAGLTELLAPGGWLVFTEPTREHPWIMASQAFMMTPPEDHRRDGPSYLSRDQWLGLLDAAGAAPVLCLPDDDHALAPQRIHLFAARMKADRVPVTGEELARFLGHRLPEHMIPSHLQVVDALPLTDNGKVDRRTLQGWRPAPVAGERRAGVEEPVDELESTLAGVWAVALGIARVGRTESLLDLGADSLVMAQVAGRLREHVPEASEIPFDALLRQMLNEPEVAALARFLRDRARAAVESPDVGENELVGQRRDASNAMLIPFSTGGEGPLRVMFHAGLGTMECYRPLARELVAQDLGPVIGVVIADTDVYCSLDPSEIVMRAADDYTTRLLADGHTRFQLIGYCLGGMYATEVARRLGERGIEVEDLVLASSHPVAFDIDEELMIEAVFVPNLGISLDQAGFGQVDPQAAVRAFELIVQEHGGRMPAGSLTALGGDPALDAVRAFFRRLGDHSQEERFAAYAKAAAEVTGKAVPPEMVSGLYRVFRQSFRAAHFTPPPYAGDIRFLRPTGPSSFAPGLDDTTLAFWREVCIGGFHVTDVGGNHFSCVEPPHVHDLAEHIAAPLRAARRR